MKLWETMRDIYEKSTIENPPVSLRIKTESIGIELGSEYNGQPCPLAGISGRLGDIPAYMGGYEVLSTRTSQHGTWEVEI